MGNNIRSYWLECLIGEQDYIDLEQQHIESDDIRQQNLSLYGKQVTQAANAFDLALSTRNQYLEQIQSLPQLSLYYKKQEEGYLVRSEWIAQCSPSQFMDFYQDPISRKNWHESIEKIESIQLQPDICVTHTVFKSLPSIGQRDMVVLEKKYTGNLLKQISSSIDFIGYPEQNGVKRVNVVVDGFVLEDIEGRTHVTWVSWVQFVGGANPEISKEICSIDILNFFKKLQSTINGYYKTS